MSEALGQPGPTSTSILGNPVLRREDDALVRGQGEYVGNVPLEGALHAHFVRSTTAHGTIESIEVDDARSMPGVVAVYTATALGLDARPGHRGSPRGSTGRTPKLVGRGNHPQPGPLSG